MTSLTADSAMDASKPLTQASWLTVGVKLLVGVALASNCFIGALLLVNHRATEAAEQRTAEVLAIRERVDVNLRETIVRLQKEFVALPQLFAVDAKKTIVERVEREFQVQDRQRLAGRESYGALFSRTEKRDLANGQTVAKIEDNELTLSLGLFDAQGGFASEVERLRLVSSQPETDLERLQTLINAAQAETQNSAGFEDKVALLRGVAADKSLEAEKSRTEILGFVDEINVHERQMAEASQEHRRFSLTVGLAAMAGNALVLFLLTRIIVERPLRRLTGIVEALGAGRYPEIPWSTRRDQIGVLCSAIGRFREVLLTLKREEERKAEDRQRIETLVAAMTAAIHGLNQRAERMAQMSLSLQELAGITERESNNVAGLAGDTARRTDEVNASSLQISAAVGDIHRELGAQNLEVDQMVGEIGQARRQLDNLRQSVIEIDAIVGAVHLITDQTKILAINAAIEAVKAGEHGRGFAVVADEVKKLSQDTALATRDVLDKIEAINSTCRAFIACFDVLDQGAAQLHQVTATIGQTVEQQRRLTGAIVALAGATGANTQEVSSRIAEVNNAAAGVLQLSGETRQCAEEIALHLGELLAGGVHDLETMSGREETAEAGRDSSATHPAPTQAQQWPEVDVRRPAASVESLPAISAQAG
ncbi:methyl-accepting chemotaxis protein [Desulfobulbus sp.]|uniref:methyl-accepting chemotaxis protein n=1 Tax=Desulfobulbus sp. TaxID=895 RepID=UPI0027B9CD93|nr:methyl-accepting chemotaxis protein [Desulfobulbus sp.]